MSNVPTKPGFYWAKWKIAEDESETFSPNDRWEVVEVIDLLGNELEVNVCGEPIAQKRENFFWGNGPLKPPN